MKIAEIGKYRLEMFESVNEVWVYKDDIHTYTIQKRIRGGWHCDCPAGGYRGYCKHQDVMLPQLMLTPSIMEPWGEWNEDAAQVRRYVETKTKQFMQ